MLVCGCWGDGGGNGQSGIFSIKNTSALQSIQRIQQLAKLWTAVASDKETQEISLDFHKLRNQCLFGDPNGFDGLTFPIVCFIFSCMDVCSFS